MTDSQKLLIGIYKVVTVSAGLVILVAYFGPGLVALYRTLFIGRVVDTTNPTDIKFSDTEFIEGYIPGLTDPMYNKPLLGCNISQIHDHHIHWEGNYEAYNLNSPLDFPDVDSTTRELFFSKVKHYPESAGEPLEYKKYIEQNYPDLMSLLELD